MIDSPTYLNKTVLCKLAPSPIHGVGVFAIQDISEGTELTDCYAYGACHYTLSEKEMGRLLPQVKELIYQRTEFRDDKPLQFVSPNCNQILQAFMNNSEDPNSDGRFALKDIKKGEEITENYKSL